MCFNKKNFQKQAKNTTYSWFSCLSLLQYESGKKELCFEENSKKPSAQCLK